MLSFLSVRGDPQNRCVRGRLKTRHSGSGSTFGVVSLWGLPKYILQQDKVSLPFKGHNVA